MAKERMTQQKAQDALSGLREGGEGCGWRNSGDKGRKKKDDPEKQKRQARNSYLDRQDEFTRAPLLVMSLLKMCFTSLVCVSSTPPSKYIFNFSQVFPSPLFSLSGC